MKQFVKEDSIVRTIWSSADTILFIFAGSAAEFALNKSVDWLYYTGKLPADPIGRMFSTVAYAREIVFSEEEKAVSAIGKINHIHRAVEEKRGFNIPAEAYLDVLFMLIDYSIRAYEILNRPLTPAEKDEVFQVFRRQGELMNLAGLPTTFHDWLVARERHLRHNLVNSTHTRDLFRQYRKHLGFWRYRMLRMVQAMLVPAAVKVPIPGLNAGIGPVLLKLYKVLGSFGLARPLRNALLPANYRLDFAKLDRSKQRKCPFSMFHGSPKGVRGELSY